MKEATEKIRIPEAVNGSLHFLKNRLARSEKPLIIGKDISWQHIVKRTLRFLIWCSVWKEEGATIYLTFKNRDVVRKTPVLELILQENPFLRRAPEDIDFGEHTVNFCFRNKKEEDIFKKVIKELNLPSKESVIWFCLLMAAKMIKWEGLERRRFYVLKRHRDGCIDGGLLFGVVPVEDKIVRENFTDETYARYKLRQTYPLSAKK